MEIVRIGVGDSRRFGNKRRITSCSCDSAWFVSKKLRAWLLWPSYLVITLALIEVTFVIVLGAVATRTLIGPAFWDSMWSSFLLGALSFARECPRPDSRRTVVSALVTPRRLSCCLFGVFLVFFQVGVGDALYGPDGCWRAVLPIGGTPPACAADGGRGGLKV
jgi:hypothetical protein